MSNMDFETEQTAFDAGDDTRDQYEQRERSRSPRRDRDTSEARNRSASPGARPRGGDYHNGQSDSRREQNNEGSNLFVTGLAQKVKEEDLREVFGKYGEVQNASIMRDPHSGDSRGFGFVKFVLVEHAEAAIEALHGFDLEGRNMSVEKARRSRPRTPTPGKYHGPPKKDDIGFGNGRGPRRDDRGYGGDRGDRRYGGGRRDDYRGGGYGSGSRYGGGDRYGGDRDRGFGGGERGGDRGGDRRYRERDDTYSGGGGGGGYGGGRVDRYASGGRDDSYRGGSRGGGGDRGPREDRGGDDRYAGGYSGGRDDRGAGNGYGGGREAAAPPPAGEPYAGGRGFDDRDSKRTA